MEELPLINEEECRLWFETDEESNLIHPCKCIGTSKYIHKNCLNEWRTLADNRDAYYKCFECGYEYNLCDQTIDNDIRCYRNVRNFSSNICFFTIFNLVIISFIAFIISSIDENKKLVSIFFKDNSTDTYTDTLQIITYMLWASMIYVATLILFFVITFMKIKNKKLYCKFYCAHSGNKYMLVISIILGILISTDLIMGLFILSILIQFIIRNHLYSIEKIREQNGFEIMNYYEEAEIST